MGFDAAVAEAARTADSESRTAALARAVEEVRGEPLEGVDYEWAEPVRERIRRRAVDALSGLADLRADVGNLDDAIALTERALQLDRASEDLYRRLMVLQQRAGRPEAARRAFKQCQLELEDLGVEPDEETRAVAEVCAAPAAVWSASSVLGGLPALQATLATPRRRAATDAGDATDSGSANRRFESYLPSFCASRWRTSSSEYLATRIRFSCCRLRLLRRAPAP